MESAYQVKGKEGSTGAVIERHWYFMSEAKSLGEIGTYKSFHDIFSLVPSLAYMYNTLVWLSSYMHKTSKQVL